MPHGIPNITSTSSWPVKTSPDIPTRQFMLLASAHGRTARCKKTTQTKSESLLERRVCVCLQAWQAREVGIAVQLIDMPLKDHGVIHVPTCTVKDVGVHPGATPPTKTLHDHAQRPTTFCSWMQPLHVSRSHSTCATEWQIQCTSRLHKLYRLGL